jgi:hypothetical protein
MSNLANRPALGLKQPPLVSTALRQSARGETCTLRLNCCNCDPSTTVLAHLRFFSWAGMGQKPDDLLAVFACSACHNALDRRASPAWGWDDVLRALGETLMRQKAKGLIEVRGDK